MTGPDCRKWFRWLPLWLCLAGLLTAAVPVLANGEGQPADTGEAAEAEAPAPKEAAAEGEPDTMNLNLKDADIGKVVNFLGEVTGKPVLQGKDVKGKVTVASPEPVTKERAIELICQALRLQDIAVVERDGVILVVQVKDLAKLGVASVEPGAEGPAAGFVRKVLPIQFADVAQVQKLIEPLLGEGAKVLADPLSRKIILTAPAEDIASLERVIAQVDVLEIQETQVRVFQLKHANATEIAPVLEAIVGGSSGGATGGKGAGAGEKAPSGRAPEQFTVVTYPTANWILVRATREKLQAAEALIAELDREKPPEVTLFVITLEYSDARELARQLSELFKTRQRTRGVRDTIEISADTRSNSLIVYATPENADLIRTVVAEVDTEESRQTETRIYDLEYADAEGLAQQMNDLYSRSTQYSYPWYSYRRQDTSGSTRFVAERHSNSLIVIAQPNEFDDIEELIDQLDQPLSASEITPRIYPIKNVDAKEITDVLNEVFVSGQTQRGGGYYFYDYYNRTQESEVGRLYGKVRFVHEPATNSVIVITNNAKNFPIIEEVIHKLDRTTAEYANTVVHRLDHADASEVADQLNHLFAPPGAGRPEDREAEARAAFYSWLMGGGGREEERPISNLIGKVRVVPDPRTNSLLITTAVQNFEVLRQLIRELDIASPKVLVKVQLIEVARTRESRVGTRLSSDATIFDSKEFNSGLVGLFGITWEEVTSDTVLTAGLDLAVLIQFLQREFDATVIGQPTLVVNNNEEASLFVGSEIPFIDKSTIEPGTTARSDSFTYRKVGTELTIKPHINRNRQVVTSVTLESSQVREGEVLFGAALIDTRSYVTQLALESEQTLVIGGILSTEESEIVHRVPILGHIPILKLLFSKRDKVVTTRELIAFITPTVLTSREEDDAATERERAAMELLREGMPEGAAPGV